MKEEVKSKKYIVFSNERGTRSEFVQYADPDEGQAVSLEDALRPIGLVYNHPHNVYAGRMAPNIVGKPITGNPQISDLVGKLLTLTDAMFIDKEQREAFKSLLKQTVYRYANDSELEIVQTYQSAGPDKQ